MWVVILIGSHQSIINFEYAEEWKKVIALQFQRKEKTGVCCHWHYPDSTTEPGKNDLFPHQVDSNVF